MAMTVCFSFYQLSPEVSTMRGKKSQISSAFNKIHICLFLTCKFGDNHSRVGIMRHMMSGMQAPSIPVGSTVWKQGSVFWGGVASGCHSVNLEQP